MSKQDYSKAIGLRAFALESYMIAGNNSRSFLERSANYGCSSSSKNAPTLCRRLAAAAAEVKTVHPQRATDHIPNQQHALLSHTSVVQ